MPSRSWRPFGFVTGGAGAAALGFTLWSSTARHRVEQPDYRVVARESGFEVRRYPAAVAAVTDIEGEFDTALGDGFRRLAGYIFGRNSRDERIAMTSPVTRAPRGERIAMTSPVGTQRTESGWQMRFIMPARYGFGELPKPLDARVRLEPLRSRDYAALRYSGRPTQARAEVKTRALIDALGRSRWRADGEPIIAIYDPPGTLPFLRRNEILVPVSGGGA